MSAKKSGEASPEVTQGNFRIDPRMLDHFSVAMYKDPKKAIGELVANGYDADATLVEVSLPSDWKSADAKIVIEDNGDGMLPEDVREKFLVLGYDKRKDVKKTSLGRKPIGSKGIGKLAGLGLARAMSYATTRKGKTSKFTIDRADLETGVTSLEKYGIQITTQRIGSSKGTVVELRPLHRDIEPVPAADLRRYLALEFARLKKFTIEVNGIASDVEELPGQEFPIEERVTDYGVVKGWYKILDDPVQEPGFSVRVRGRIVKPRTTFSIGPSASKAINYAYIVGDIRADFLDPDAPTSKLEEFTISTDREGFNEASPAYKAFELWAVAKLKSIAATVQQIRSARVQRKVARSPAIQRTLKKLPTRVREQVLLLSARLVRELPWETEDEIVDLIKAITESRAMDEVMIVLKQLLSADDRDVRGFAKLLTQYGLADLWKLSDHVATRLEVIDQFEKLTTRIDVLETKEIHPVVENNMWLVSDDYVPLASNEQIRTFLLRDLGLEGVPEKDRPDFICKRRKKLMVIIELKRGAYKLAAADFAQVCRYIDILRKYLPSTPICAFMIGGSSNAQADSRYGDTPVKLTTYTEMLDDVRDRYSEFTKLLKKTPMAQPPSSNT